MTFIWIALAFCASSFFAAVNWAAMNVSRRINVAGWVGTNHHVDDSWRREIPERAQKAKHTKSVFYDSNGDVCWLHNVVRSLSRFSSFLPPHCKLALILKITLWCSKALFAATSWSICCCWRPASAAIVCQKRKCYCRYHLGSFICRSLPTDHPIRNRTTLEAMSGNSPSKSFRHVLISWYVILFFARLSRQPPKHPLERLHFLLHSI